MKKSRILGAVCATTFVFSTPSHAVPVSFDFAGAGGDLNTNTLTVNGVTAESFYWSGSVWGAADLYQRNTSNDHGLGVCSPPETECQGGTGNAGGGNINELSNQEVYEVIRLDKGTNATWVELWVSSLDSSEIGTLFWGNSSDIDSLLSGGSSFSYDSTDFGSGVEGDILALAAAIGFDAAARYVLFTPGPTALATGNDNDYLVWKGAVNPVPIPAAVWLFGSGLLGLVGIARCKKAA